MNSTKKENCPKCNCVDHDHKSEYCFESDVVHNKKTCRKCSYIWTHISKREIPILYILHEKSNPRQLS